MSRLASLVLMFLPSRVKVFVLRALGHPVSKSAYIGLSFVHAKKLLMEDNTHIGHGNVFSHLEALELHEGSRINRWNRFSSAPSYRGVFRLGMHSSIALRHYFDVCGDFCVGANTIIAGHRSTFFTHSKGVDIIDYTAPIRIGDWCYIGSNVSFTPGAAIGSNIFVGMGAVITKDFGAERYVLIAGNPAIVRKTLDSRASYFTQGDLIHPHDPSYG